MSEVQLGEADILKIQQVAEEGVRYRGLEEYLTLFGLNKEDLEGKTILDIGSGASKFAKDIERVRINATVISIDPIARVQEEKGKQHRFFVTGKAQAIPLKSDTIDLALAAYTVPMWYFGITQPIPGLKEFENESLENMGLPMFPKHREIFLDGMTEIIKEIHGALKPGGKAMFAPFDVHYGGTDFTTRGISLAPSIIFRMLRERLARENSANIRMELVRTPPHPYAANVKAGKSVDLLIKGYKTLVIEKV